jgi:hypothetical protein
MRQWPQPATRCAPGARPCTLGVGASGRSGLTHSHEFSALARTAVQGGMPDQETLGLQRAARKHAYMRMLLPSCTS